MGLVRGLFLLFVYLDNKPLVDGTREKLSYSVLQSEQHIGAGFGEKKCGKKAASVTLGKLPAQEHAQGGGTGRWSPAMHRQGLSFVVFY